MIFGDVAKISGKIIFKGKEINPKSPREAIDHGIALVPEDRKRHGALLTLSIKNNISMPIYKKISRASVINTKTEIDIANNYKKNLLIKTPSIHQAVKNLSGGNQQKVILGKWLAANSELIIFDEPTRGIDVGAKFEIYSLINNLVEQGKSILLISSEMEELMGMSDRIIVLAEGKMTGELQKNAFDQNSIMRMASAV
jgi:ribose transport system ATP-binding protein